MFYKVSFEKIKNKLSLNIEVVSKANFNNKDGVEIYVPFDTDSNIFMVTPFVRDSGEVNSFDFIASVVFKSLFNRDIAYNEHKDNFLRNVYTRDATAFGAVEDPYRPNSLTNILAKYYEEFKVPEKRAS